jgi:hypothetical protein
MAGESRQVFISYARRDAERVGALVEGLRQLRYEAWLDEALIGGQAWWDEVLRQIRAGSAVLVAVSPAALDSVAVRREYEYGHAVGRPLLPVIVDTVLLKTLPSLLARIEVVDCRQPDMNSAFALVAALAALPAPQALPQPLPEPPPIPVSYLSGLKERSQATTLSLDEQLALVGLLKVALGRESEREDAEEMLRSLQNRNDLYQVSAREIRSLLSLQNRQVPASYPHEAPSGRPGGTSPRKRGMHQIIETPKSVGHDRTRAAQLITVAERIAQSIADEGPKEKALAEIAMALAATDLDRAERIARSITSDIRKASALVEITKGLAATDPDRAESIARSITSDIRKVSALVEIANRLVATDSDRAAGLIDDAERIAQSATNSSIAWSNIAMALAATDPDRAERIALAITFTSSQVVALANIANGLAATDPDRAARLAADAERIAQSVDDKFSKAGYLAELAKTLATTDPDRAARLIAQSERIASYPEKFVYKLMGTSGKSLALQRVAEAMAVTDPGRAERIAQSLTDKRWYYKSNTLANIAVTVAVTDPDRAERIAQSITAEGHRDRALSGIAMALAATDPDRAEYVAQSITSKIWKVKALAGIATA